MNSCPKKLETANRYFICLLRFLHVSRTKTVLKQYVRLKFFLLVAWIRTRCCCRRELFSRCWEPRLTRWRRRRKSGRKVTRHSFPVSSVSSTSALCLPAHHVFSFFLQYRSGSSICFYISVSEKVPYHESSCLPVLWIRTRRIPNVFGPPGSEFISQMYGSGSGSFPFLIKVLSGLKMK